MQHSGLKERIGFKNDHWVKNFIFSSFALEKY